MYAQEIKCIFTQLSPLGGLFSKQIFCMRTTLLFIFTFSKFQ